jgi:hypothetical protein
MSPHSVDGAPGTSKDWRGVSIANQPRRLHDHGMSTANNSRITLELEAGADPIRGSIEHADGRRQPFWGWLELSEELRRVAAAQPEPPSPENAEAEPEPDAQAKGRPPHTTREEQP